MIHTMLSLLAARTKKLLQSGPKAATKTPSAKLGVERLDDRIVPDSTVTVNGQIVANSDLQSNWRQRVVNLGRVYENYQVTQERGADALNNYRSSTFERFHRMGMSECSPIIHTEPYLLY